MCQVFPSTLGPFAAYTPLTLTWSTCPSSSAPSLPATVDLYLNVEESSGLVPVHVWTGITFKDASLATQLRANWWNATSGQAEDVQARFIMVQSGGQVWASSFPASGTVSLLPLSPFASRADRGQPT